ncbi:MAG TPA: chromate efflux transporter [Fimbriimonas sp.]|nr:chromate efflux transporter [Fimbriimonas sp.]
MSRRQELGELARLFLVLGALGFGGPPAHLAMFEQEAVQRKKWLTSEELLELIGAANLIPGPNSTEVAFSIGLRRAGLPGMIVAGVCFILPAALITAGLAYAYVRFGALPSFSPFLFGTKAAIIGVIVGATMRLAPAATKTLPLTLLGILALILSVLNLPEVAILVACGLLAIPGSGQAKVTALGAWILAGRAAAAGAAMAIPVSLGGLFLFFLYVGATIFGGGFVLASYLQTGLVQNLGWLSSGQLLDAITVGQVTPGPVFSTATFVGYLIGGPMGALVATVGIFLPCFFLVPALHKLMDWARKHPNVPRFIDGVAVGALGLMLAVAIKLAPASLDGWFAVSLAVGAGLATVYRINAGLVVLVAGLLGYLTRL